MFIPSKTIILLIFYSEKQNGSLVPSYFVTTPQSLCSTILRYLLQNLVFRSHCTIFAFKWCIIMDEKMIREYGYMLRMVGFGENIGSGFPKIIAAWKETNWGEPKLKNKVELDEVELVLPVPAIGQRQGNVC